MSVCVGINTAPVVTKAKTIANFLNQCMKRSSSNSSISSKKYPTKFVIKTAHAIMIQTQKPTLKQKPMLPKRCNH